jgi:hypothetical protein
MAEFTKPKSPFAEYKRELIIIVLLGFGAAFYSLGTFILYAAPSQEEVKITLTARNATSPRETLARRAQREAVGGRAGRGDSPSIASAARPPASVAAISAAPTSTRAETAVTAPVVAVAAPARPERPTNERVRMVRVRVGGEWVEMHDFSRGIAYTGEIHDFTSGVPRSIRERERSAR